MAKKSRRARQRTAKVAQPARISRPTKSPDVAAVTSDVELATEYRYVVEDLRRIGITALALLVLLIVLAIIIT